MDYETTNVSGSKGFFQVERVQLAVLLKTTGCSLRPFFIAIGRGFRGVIFPSALAISAWYIPRFSRWAKRGVWKRMFEHLAKDADTRDNMGHSTVDVTQNIYTGTWWEQRKAAVEGISSLIWSE